jgi:AhpD family alkylhydroperoxidase
MSESFARITQDVSHALGAMRKDVPDTMRGFSALAKAALAPGVMSALDKELIALAIGVASRCDACIGFHIKTLIKLGVSRAQLMETLAVCTYMGGGPSVMYAAQAVRAYEEFTANKQ